MTSILRAEFGDTDKVSVIVAECRRMNIEVLPPDVNESFKNFAMVSKQGEPGRIRFGLSAIKNVGEHICEVIYRERKNNGQYTSLENLFERVTDKDLNKKSIESLVKVGAMDCFGYDRGLLLANVQNMLGYSKQIKEHALTNQASLFSGTSIAVDNKVTLKNASDATMDEKLEWEKSLLGIYLSSHPFAWYNTIMADALTPLSETEYHPRDEWIVIGGVIDKLVKKITKKGSIMIFATLQDQTGRVEMLVFPKTFEQTRTMWEEGKVVCVVGKTPKEEGDDKIFVENVYALNHQNAEQIARQVKLGQAGSIPKKQRKKQEQCLVIQLEEADVPIMAQPLNELFAMHDGTYAVYIDIAGKKIRVPYKIEYSDEFKEGLKNIIGNKPVFLHK